MKIEMNQTEIVAMANAIEVKVAALQRQANTEKNVTVKAIREQEIAFYNQMTAKLYSKEITDETNVSKQTK